MVESEKVFEDFSMKKEDHPRKIPVKPGIFWAVVSEKIILKEFPMKN